MDPLSFNVENEEERHNVSAEPARDIFFKRCQNAIFFTSTVASYIVSYI
jgi:hypothetical protein